MSAGNVIPPTAAAWSSAWFWSARSATSPRCSCRWSGPGRTWRSATATTSCGLIVEFYGQMEQVLQQHITVLRDSAPSG